MLYSRKLLLGQGDEGDEGEAVTDSPKVPEATLWTRAKTLYARLESKRPASEKVLKEVPEVTAVRIHYPATLSREQARTIYNELLETQIQKHKKWLIIDGALLPFSALLTLVPGPNLALAYLAWRTLGHYKGRALGQSMSELEVTFVAVDLLERLQKVVTPFFTFHRARKIRDVARTLELPGLARVYLKSK